MAITNITGTGPPNGVPGDSGSTYTRTDGPPFFYRKRDSGWVAADTVGDDGIVPIDTLPVGTGASQVAAGNHTHGGGGSFEFPVGYVIITVIPDNPGVTLGYGTWAAFGAGRVLVGVDAGDTDFDTAEETGGAKTVAAAGSVSTPTFTGSSATTSSDSAGTPSGTNTGAAVSAHSGTAVADHASHTHTYTDVPNHVHVQTVNSATTGGTSGYTPDTSTNTGVASGYSTANPTGGVATGTTAGPSATLTHSVTQPSAHTVTQPTFAGNALGAHSHTVTATGTNSTPTFTGTPTSVVQPYLCVYFWKRTA
jgi:hypothetical protein